MRFAISKSDIPKGWVTTYIDYIKSWYDYMFITVFKQMKTKIKIKFNYKWHILWRKLALAKPPMNFNGGITKLRLS